MKRQANPNQLDLCLSQAVEPVTTGPEPWVKERRSIFIRCLAHWDEPKPKAHKRNHAKWLQLRIFELGGLGAVW